MQDYRRRIAYLYAYEHGVQTRSAGFVKAEERAGVCRIHIHLKGYCSPNEPTGKAYLFFYYRNRGVGIALGELEEHGGSLEWHGEWRTEKFRQKGIRFSETGGVWIRRPTGQEYVAEWDDEPVDISRFILYPPGGMKCLCCPRLEDCERSSRNEADGRGKIYDGSNPAGT